MEGGVQRPSNRLKIPDFLLPNQYLHRSLIEYVLHKMNNMMYNSLDQFHILHMYNYIHDNLEIIRIWTSVRFANKISQTLNGFPSIILGDESLLVNPMTGRGVSNNIFNCYKFAELLSKYENFNSIYSNLINYLCEFGYLLTHQESELH